MSSRFIFSSLRMDRSLQSPIRMPVADRCRWYGSTKAMLCREPMTFRVERLVVGDVVVLRVSGRIEADGVDTLRDLLKHERGKVAIDLKEVNLINREVIRFLAVCEASGVELRNCADYIG